MTLARAPLEWRTRSFWEAGRRWLLRGFPQRAAPRASHFQTLEDWGQEREKSAKVSDTRVGTLGCPGPWGSEWAVRVLGDAPDSSRETVVQVGGGCDASGHYSFCWAPLEPRWLLLVIGRLLWGRQHFREQAAPWRRAGGGPLAALPTRCPPRAAAGPWSRGGCFRLFPEAARARLDSLAQDTLVSLLTCSRGTSGASWLLLL